MKNTMFNTLPNTDFSIHLMDDIELRASKRDVKNLVTQIRDYNVNFATIDLGITTYREFEKTPLSKNLKKLNIPYFTIELPYYVKDHFARQINELKEKYYELRATYDILEDKNKSTAQELNSLMRYYSKELREIKNYININVRTKLIFKKILSLITGKDNKSLRFIHFGERNFFMGIFNLIESIRNNNQILNKK
ncbi:MAG: hypothetical protein ACFE9S_04065 [Candidatus Hermodarchaeota archaeon]